MSAAWLGEVAFHWTLCSVWQKTKKTKHSKNWMNRNEQQKTLGVGQTIWSEKHGICPFRCSGVQVFGVQVFWV